MAEPMKRMSPLRWCVWLLDEALDRMPGYWDGWRWRGMWGCRLGLGRFWGAKL